MKVRAAAIEDLDTIIRFIHALAEYEREPNAVVLDRKELASHLFGAPKRAHTLLAEDDDGRPVGFALYFFNFSTWLGKPGVYVEDLFVLPEERGKKYGRALLAACARAAKDGGAGRLEWAVLDWNRPAIDFYESLGAMAMNEWTTYRLTGEKLAALAV